MGEIKQEYLEGGKKKEQLFYGKDGIPAVIRNLYAMGCILLKTFEKKNGYWKEIEDKQR